MEITLNQTDCLKAMKELPDNNIDMILCDLPYGTTTCKWDVIIPFDKLWEQYERIIKSNGAIVLTAQTPFDKVLGASNLPMLRYEWIWKKDSGTGFLNAKKAPLKNHENILVFYKKTPIYTPQMRFGFKPYSIKKSGDSQIYSSGLSENITTISNGDRYPLTVIDFKRDKDKFHPTQKPVALMEYLIKTYTNESETVLDNCMGSGTTGVACVNLNRNFIGYELDSDYFQIAQKRIENAKNKIEECLI